MKTSRRLSRVFLLLVFAALTASRVRAQAPAFEVASVKPNTSKTSMMSLQGTPEQYGVTNAPLRRLILMAYQVMDFQLVDGPSWITEDRFDVVAKIPQNATPQQIPVMLQALLAERFKLVVHRETRELPTYELVVAHADRRLGPELRKTDVDCAAVAAAVKNGANVPVLPPQRPGKAPKCGMLGGPAVISVSGVTMTELASTLSQRVGRVVADRTRLAGQYDVELTFAPDDSASAPLSDAPSLFTAIQEQLGLRLSSSKGRVEVVVIDRVDRLVNN